MNKCLLALIGMTVAGIAAAQPPVAENALGWHIEAELGIIDTSGNRDTRTINGKLNAVQETSSWRNKLQAEYLEASDDTGLTAKRVIGQAATNYKLDENDYLFANLRYEDDRFAGYDYRVSETVGYGHRFNWDAQQRLDLEAGAGGRHVKLLTGDHEDEPIGRLALAYAWQFSETSEFTQTAFSELSDDNIHSESETGLKLRIDGRLAMKLSYKILTDSDPPAGTEDTDTLTALTLVYDLSPR